MRASRQAAFRRAALARAARALPAPVRLPLLAGLVVLAWLLAPAAAQASRQSEPELGAILREAIADPRCDDNDDHFDEEVFLKLQEPRLRRFVPDAELRESILRAVWCETHRIARRYREQKGFELRMPPELVLAVMDVESRFDRYAVSSAGAVGLMQIMPFWPRALGVENRLFGTVDFNVRLGCAILAHYLHRERNDYVRALGRYNGSLGRREYPDLVLSRLASRWRS